MHLVCFRCCFVTCTKLLNEFVGACCWLAVCPVDVLRSTTFQTLLTVFDEWRIIVLLSRWAFLSTRTLTLIVATSSTPPQGKAVLKALSACTQGSLLRSSEYNHEAVSRHVCSAMAHTEVWEECNCGCHLTQGTAACRHDTLNFSHDLLLMTVGTAGVKVEPGQVKPPKGSKPEHKNSRAARRGPMDEMRQLIRILAKLMPHSEPYLRVGGEDTNGGNRVSEEQIRNYLATSLGEAPQPEWGLPQVCLCSQTLS